MRLAVPLSVVVLAAAASAALAAAPVPTPAADAPGESLPLWEVGLGALGGWQPAYPGAAGHVHGQRVLPYGLYRGSVLRVEDGSVGLRAVRTPRTEWGLSGSFSFGGGANDVPARAGMPALGTLVEAGPQLRVNLGPMDEGDEAARRTRLYLPLRMVFDASDGFARRGWSFEPRLGHVWWQSGGTSVSSSFGLLVGDRRLNDLFYAVAPAYATPDRPTFTARAGLVALRAGLSWAHALSSNARLYAYGGLETVNGAANVDSPLVHRHTALSLGVGATWGFWRSADPAKE